MEKRKEPKNSTSTPQLPVVSGGFLIGKRLPKTTGRWGVLAGKLGCEVIDLKICVGRDVLPTNKAHEGGKIKKALRSRTA